MSKIYDVIVIGAGSGGLGMALGMSQLNFEVLLIDRNEKAIGGECLNTGCIPSKALLHVASQIRMAGEAAQYGLEVSGSVEMNKVRASIKSKQAKIKEKENAEFLREKGMEVALGNATFVSNNEVEVEGMLYRGRKIIIATGSAPRKIKIKGDESVPVYTHEEVFDIPQIPQNFVFIGAGPVSMELAQAFSRLGSRVSVIVRGKRILEKEDRSIASILEEKMKQEGINFFFETEVSEIQNNKALLKNQTGTETTIPVDALFFGIGRVLNFDSLNLEKAGVKTKKGKIILNEYLQTSNKNIFVSGDAADNLKFSHAAEMHNILLIKNFFLPKKKKFSDENFSWVTFTDPEIATFGLNEDDIKSKDIKYERLEISFEETDRATTNEFRYGKLLLYVEKKLINPGNAKILGGSMVAPHAGEIIQELILARVAGIKLKTFLDKIYPYPTAGNIHKIIIRDRITKAIGPWMKRAMKIWFRRPW